MRRLGLALSILSLSYACGGNTSSPSGDGGGGGGGDGGGGGGGPGRGGGSGAGGFEAGKADGAEPAPGNAPECPATPAENRSTCSKAYLYCTYVDSDRCPRPYVCMYEGGLTGVTTGPLPPLLWMASTPAVDEACSPPGLACTYPMVGGVRIVCSNAGKWRSAN